MYCMNCGAQMDDNAAFCPICNMPVVPQPEQSYDYGQKDVNQGFVNPTVENGAPVRKKRTRKKLSRGKKVCIAAGVLAVMVLAVWIYYLKSPARQVVKELREDNYVQAYATYNDEVDGSMIQEKLLNVLLKQELKRMDRAFEADEMDFDTIVGRLNVILRFDIREINERVYEQIIAIATVIMEDYETENIDYEGASEQISALVDLCNNEDKAVELTKLLSELSELKASRDAYAKAEEAYEAGNYSTALDEYSQVSENDSNYEDAQTKIAECTEQYRQEILDQMENPESDSEYENAISLVTIALGVLPEDAELTERLNSLTEEYAALLKSEALTQGTEYINAGNYAEAFALINKALEYNEGDSELVSFLTSSQSAYESYIAEQVNAFTAGYDYDSALALLDTALSTLPDSTALTELREQTEENQPVKLCDIKVAESEYYEQITELVVTEDSMGNQYNPGNLFKVSCYFGSSSDIKKGYAKYYLNGDYTKLKGTIVAADDSEITGCVLTVYGDNKILYTSNLITRSTSPLAFDLDVTGITWIHMEFSVPEDTEGAEWDRWMRVLLADMTLYKN